MVGLERPQIGFGQCLNYLITECVRVKGISPQDSEPVSCGKYHIYACGIVFPLTCSDQVLIAAVVSASHSYSDLFFPPFQVH